MKNKEPGSYKWSLNNYNVFVLQSTSPLYPRTAKGPALGRSQPVLLYYSSEAWSASGGLSCRQGRWLPGSALEQLPQ